MGAPTMALEKVKTAVIKRRLQRISIYREGQGCNDGEIIGEESLIEDDQQVATEVTRECHRYCRKHSL